MISFLYKSIIHIRNFLYDIKFFKIYTSTIPVISVGNLTVGGTGKTPFVLFLIKCFTKKNLTPLVISRGYGRSSKGQIIINSKSDFDVKDIGDEPYLISKKFPQIDIVINHKRVDAVKWAEKSDKKYDVIILDDGYQHRSIFRNINILLISGKQNHDFLLPRGILREPIKNINRADCVIFTKGGPDKNLVKLISKTPSFSTVETFSKSNIKHDKGIAFCGIGDSDSFLETLNKLSINVVKSLKFKDHEKYSPSIIKKIEFLLKKTNQTTFFTTEKDWVKLPGAFIRKYSGCYIIMNVTIKDSSFYAIINTLS